MKAESLIHNLEFPEGPCFDAQGRLWFTELKAGNLVCFDHGAIQKFHVGINVNGAAVDQNDYIWFTDSGAGCVSYFNTARHEIVPVCNSVEGEILKRPNDLAFDSKGNLIVSCHADGRTQPVGYLICIDMLGNARYISKNKYFTNGIAFSPDGSYFIFSETYRQCLWKAQWDPDRKQIIQEVPWAKTDGPLGPDGIAFDETGLLYVAIFDQGKISVFDESGDKEKWNYQLSAKRPTSCAFDPSGQLGLVITEAQNGEVLHLPLKKKGLPLFKRSFYENVTR